MKLPEFAKQLTNKELIELIDLLVHVSRCGRLPKRNENVVDEERQRWFLLNIVEVIARSEEKEG